MLLFLVIVALGFLFILSRANGFTDPFYIRFTTPTQQNMIIGTSRSAQGIVPSSFKSILKKDLFNYSFTASHSPFGPTYLNSIKKKIDVNTKDGIFILSIDPWAISGGIEDPNNASKFPENSLMLANMETVSGSPNFEYLLQELKGNYHLTLFNTNTATFLHQDGWLEVTVPMDSVSVATRTKNKIKNYRTENLPNMKISQTRIEYLNQTIDFLKSYGSVYLVRLPVGEELLEIEKEYSPNFDDLMRESIAKSNGYLDLTKSDDHFFFTDGNHLWKDSAINISNKIAAWIKMDKQ
jgi:hypothetical protein